MQTRKLDASEDIIFGHGKKDILQGNLAIAQMVKNALLMTQGDWFLDRSHGLPYFSESFLHKVNLSLIKSLIKNTILGVQGVQSILDFTTTIDDRKRSLGINCIILTNTGETVSINQSI